MGEWRRVFQSNIGVYVRLIASNFLLKNGWHLVDVGSVLEKNTLHAKGAVQAKDYQKVGLLPIVSQSKDIVSGYTDRVDLVVHDVPVIVFGDHTQVIKCIDFPFVVGADGVKLLTPQHAYNPQFFYYLLRSIDLNSDKYARHFSLLRKSLIPLKVDSTELQHKIIEFLSDFENDSLKGVVYFDHETELSIVSLHRSLLLIALMFSEFELQSQHLKQLRQAVLQEAVEGKLTADWRKQHPNPIPHLTSPLKGEELKNLPPLQGEGRGGDGFKGNPQHDAAALLAQIKAEKERLIKAGKLKQEKPISPICDSDKPFVLPLGWAWTRLPQLLAFGNSLRRGPFGSAITKDMFVPKDNESTKIYEQKNAIYKDFTLGNYYINLGQHPNLASFLTGPGDMLIEQFSKPPAMPV